METGQTGTRVRWYSSLVFRVILLCGVLVFCLFWAVYGIAYHYVHTVIGEMEEQTKDIAKRVVVVLEANPDDDLSDLMREFKEDGFDTEYGKLEGERVIPTQVTFTHDAEGRILKVAQTTFTSGDQQFLLTVRVALDPQTEIVKAFSKQSMALVTLVFLVALGLMMYFIVRILRPIQELSDSCARISEGELRNVAIRRNAGEILALERTFNQMVGSLREKQVMEANLRQAQRLSALGTLAAGIAHDVRNPLNAIKLLSSHALDTIGDGSAAKQLRTIRDEVDRLDEIVSGFLSLSKEGELRPKPSRVDPLLDECLRLIRKDAEDRDVVLTSDLRAGNKELMLDAKQFTRAVLNVLLNALEACGKGGRGEAVLAVDGPVLRDRGTRRRSGTTERSRGTGIRPVFHVEAHRHGSGSVYHEGDCGGTRGFDQSGERRRRRMPGAD